ncbi:MAG: hypothetical protein U0X75_15520 [Acidobacteriota bacterium]
MLENAEVIATNGVKFEELLDHSFIPRGDSNPPTGVLPDGKSRSKTSPASGWN